MNVNNERNDQREKSRHCIVGLSIKHLRMIPTQVPPGEVASMEDSCIECAALSSQG